MANKHLSLFPMSIDSNNWYYEEPGGIDFIHMQQRQCVHEGIEMTDKQAVHIKISWRKLRASLGRKDRKL